MTIYTIDMHTGGEPLRIITGGLPEIQGNTVLEKRRFFRDHLDHLRTGLMWEPRGHADMYGVILTPPNDNNADFGAFFIHNEGYSTMCGHAVIALAKYAAENGMARISGNTAEMNIDVPAGRIKAVAHISGGKIRSSSFLNVPSFVHIMNQETDLQGIGKVKFDIAYGGAFYVFVNSEDFNLRMLPGNAPHFIDLGRKIKDGISEKYPVIHPFEKDLSFLYGTIFTGKAENPAHHSRNVCIFADGELDRSATGSGVSARAALHYAKGDLGVGEKIIIESILGTTMEVEITETSSFGPYPAVIPKVTGQAFYTGEHAFLFEDDDPLKGGFMVR